MDIDIDGRVRARMEEVCNLLHLSEDDFVKFAIENEIMRQEIHLVKDEITIQEINKNVLGQGQSLNFSLVEDNVELNRQVSTCQMCLREFGRPLDRVEGPMFCDDCLGLARGGDFSKVASRF